MKEGVFVYKCRYCHKIFNSNTCCSSTPMGIYSQIVNSIYNIPESAPIMQCHECKPGKKTGVADLVGISVREC